MAVDISDRPSKRARLLSDDEDSGSESSDADPQQLKINSEYAKRFEHNKKREDLHRLQEKYGKDGDAENDDGDSSDDESEDDVAELITHELDHEIMDTLKALRAKDPRIYDKNSEFYKTPIDAAAQADRPKKKEKAVTLQDYHRENLLNGSTVQDDDADESTKKQPMTYNEEQAALKRDLVNQMHAADGSDDAGEDADGSDDDGFFARKPGQEHKTTQRTVAIDEEAIANADKDPEAFLDKFMTSRAWEQNDPKFKPFDSDDSEDDARAEEFEQAYNLRFEDPERSNEKLVSHSRTTAAKHSARREELSGRQKARQREKEEKEAAKRQRDEEKQRLRKLKLDAAQDKLNKFKEVADLRGKDISDRAWEKFMSADFDDDNWEQELAKHFDDEYYAAQDLRDGEEGSTKAPKKPKWEDDIDVDDIVPDFDEQEARAAATYTLSDNEENGEEDESDGGVPLNEEDVEMEGGAVAGSKRQSKKSKKKATEDKVREQKRQARREKMRLEELVDKDMTTDDVMIGGSKGGFRYRETSPGAFGLSAREILMADDAQLNEYVGLKKLASFRDEEKKQRDKKKLGKKDRLRKWRKETFGDRDGPTMSFQEFLQTRMPAESQPRPAHNKAESASNVIERDGESGKRKKKHRGGKKRKAAEQS